MQGKIILLASLMIAFNTFTLQAQKTLQQKLEITQKVKQDKNVTDVFLSEERETPSSVLFDFSRPVYKRTDTRSLLRSYLSLRNGYDNVEPVKNLSITPALNVQEFQQYFKGLPVAYSHYKALMRNEDVLMLAGSYYEVPAALSATPVISESQALLFAKKQVGATKYAWEEVQYRIAKVTDKNVKALLLKELQEYLPKGELVIIKDFTNKAAIDMRLAYKFNLYAAEPLSRGYIYIDAITGKTLLYDALIKHASVPTTVHTRYAGNRQVYTKQISGTDPGNGQTLVSSHPTTEPTYVAGAPTYVLMDDTRGGGIETYDLNNVGGLPLSVPGLYAQAKSFTDVDNNWTLAEHKRSAMEGGANEAENDDIAWDAHWGAEVVYDYWLARHNRRSYDDKGTSIKSYIHYGPAYDNAFWNGTVMTYGDGSGNAATGFKALTSLDVCGHEIGHGVCSSTSDLVYEKESGAMNEAFSDIWASCIENFAIKVIDPSLGSIYKPFFIGEQISLTTDPLRRMDAPKVTGNPDTYNGENWTNPDCTPNLANDECGVHNNSGVLNKWFYLLTCGSGNGSGPDAGYVIPGADDELRDSATTAPHNDGGHYSVTGLGFNISEQIAFLTEVMLSSTATYAEAREMSVAAAKAYSGDPCGNVVQSVTNAWYAVGVGNAFVAPCSVTYGFIYQPGTTIPEGRNGMGCSGNDTIVVPVLLPANSTANISAGGNATNGKDYTILSTTLSNTTGSNKTDSVFVVIYNDGVVEGTETISLTVNITNLGSNTSNNSYVITIEDDDVVPVLGNDSVVVMNENFEGVTEGFNLPPSWAETLLIPEVAGADPTTNGKNHWGVFALNGSKQLAITGRTSLVTAPSGTYINLSTSTTRAHTQMLDGRGLGNLNLEFTYSVQGEVDPTGADPESFPKLDYMEVYYSYDNVTYNELGSAYTFASAAVTSGSFKSVLPSFLANKQFYLAFLWNNDANAGGPVSVSVDNLKVKGLPRKIETVANRSGSEQINGAQNVYFYSDSSGNILANVNATGTHNYGCVTATVERAGNSAAYSYNDAFENILSSKVIRLTPTTNNAAGNYTITLFYTEQEIVALENATGLARTNFKIYKTSAATIDGATSANTVKQAVLYTAIPGVGGRFTTAFATGFSAFALGGELPLSYYRSRQTGNWNNPATWESSLTADFASVISPAKKSPTSTNSITVTVRNTHTVTLTADVSSHPATVNTGGLLLVNTGINFTLVP